MIHTKVVWDRYYSFKRFTVQNNFLLFFLESSMGKKFEVNEKFIKTVVSTFLANSDFPTDQTFHQFHDLYTELDLHRFMSGFHGSFATGVASQQGTLTLPDTWFRPPFWDLLMLQLLRPNSSNLPCLYSTFHLEYPLVLSRFCLWMTFHKLPEMTL